MILFGSYNSFTYIYNSLKLIAMYEGQDIGDLFVDTEGNLCKNYDTIIAVVTGFFTTKMGRVGYELVKKPKYNSDEDY